MFKSFKSLKTVRTLFDQAENLYRVAKRVLEKVGSRFRDGYKRFAKNSLFYTEALPNVIGVTTSYTKGAGFESINQSQVSGLRSFSAYDIIGASSIDDQYLTFKPNVSSSDYPKPTFDPDDSVGAGIFTKSLWNHNQFSYTKDMFSDDAYSLYWTKGDNWRESWATWTNLGEVAPNGSNAYEVIVSGNSVNYFVAFRGGNYNLDNIGVFDDTKVSMFSMYIKAPEDTSKAVDRFRVIMTDRSSPVQYPSIYWRWDSENSRWEEEPLTGQPASTRIAHTEDLGNGWQRITAGVIGSDYTTATNSGDELEIDLRFENLSLSANKGFIFAEPQFEQHPINKPSWSHNSVWQDMEQWTEGTGNQGSDWAGWGDATDSVREYRTDPFGKQSILWVSQDNDTTKNGEGGFESLPNISIDASASYRFSVWMRKPSDFIGNATIYFGSTPNYASNPLYAVRFPVGAYTVQTNPYFITGSQSTLLPNPGEWYLAVGFIDASGTNRGSYHPDTGFYDFEGNQRQAGTIRSWEFSSTATHQSIRAFQNANPAGQGDEIEFWAPRIDKLDGNEPSISDLLNPIDNPNYPPVTKATPYVGNDAIPANVHRHNWLNYTEYLEGYTTVGIDLTVSSIEDALLNGEKCYRVVAQDEQYPYISGSNLNTLYYDASADYIASMYVKRAFDNIYMPAMNSNLSGFDKWSVGTGDDPSTDWSENPDLNENERLYLDTPFGGLDVVWRGTNLDTDNDGEGGYRSTHFNIDRTKKYRFSQFVRTSTHNDTAIYLGQSEAATADPINRQLIRGNDGLPAQNYDYFAAGYRLPSSDEWYLMVTHIHPEGTSTPVRDDDTGLYDMSGNLVDNSDYFRDFVFSSTTTETMIRGLSFYNRSANPDTVDFWHPRVDALDGNEPSIERLLDSVKAKQPAVNFPAFAEIPWLDEGLTNFGSASGWNAPDTVNATSTTSSLKTPFNTEEVVVVANNEPSPDGPYEGGLTTKWDFFLPIDNTKKYRYCIFAKKATNEGGIYLGPSNGSQPSIAVRRLDNGFHQTNPYFIHDRDFGTSEWVLLVGHIWPHTTAVGTAKDPDTGIWSMDGTQTIEIVDIDFMTSSTTTEQSFRAFFYGDVTDDLNKAYFWQPRIDIVDGTEPSIQELLRIHPGIRMAMQDYTAPASQVLGFNANFNASGVPYSATSSNNFHAEEVGNGWYRISDYAGTNSNLVEGDSISPIIYPFDSSSPWADLSAYATREATYIMRPMVEIVDKNAPKLSPPTAYQYVENATWPSVSAIPYHQVAKEVELSIKDDTTGSSYTAKAYWDGGKLYNYGPRITNQDVEITQLQDGWHKFGTGIRGLGDGTINAGDTASMTFSYAASSNPRSKTLISGPILANTGSEKSSKVNYSPGTQTPGVNFIVDTVNWDDWVSSDFLGRGLSYLSMDKIDTSGPYDPSSFLFKSDEGIQYGQDYILAYPYDDRDGTWRSSAYDTAVAHIHAKSLWNYNELPYTRNILDDPNFTDGSDQYGSFYAHQGQYTVVDGETGPDGYSKVLSFSSPYSGFLTRSVLQYPYFNWNWYNHRWDENMISTFSVFVKAPDNPEETPTQFRFNFIDNLNPQDTEYQFFSWGPNQAPKESISNTIPKGFVEDVGDGWYRLSVSVSGLLDEDGIKTKNGDTQVIKWEISQFEDGQNFKMCQPQLEHHRINDTNLLKPSWDWYETDGAQGTYVNGWSLYGANNKISLREDPFGLSSLCVAGFDDNTNDGGIVDYPLVPIDSSSTYRYSFFMRFVDTSADTRVLFGPNSYNVNTNPEQTVRRFDGVIDGNPYFSASFRYSNIGDDWVLVVAHLHDSSESFPITNHPDTGVYRMDGTEISYSIYDYASSSVTTTQGGRIFSIGSTDDNGREIYQIWSPRVEKVDGTEPSISELLASGNLWTNPNYQQTLPSPYVENVGIHPNPHRHNWLVATNDLDNASYWNFGNGLTMEASTVQTTYANGETCFIMRNGSEADQYGYINQNNYQMGHSFDVDNEYIASIYVKRDEPYTGSLDKIYLTLRDNTNPYENYAIEYNFSGSVINNTYIASQLVSSGVNGGYEELPEGWYRLWLHVPNVLSSTVDNDNLSFVLYNGQYGTPYANKELIVMRPMLEIVPPGTVVNNVPRAYQEVDGVWDLGVTSIPEHQCANSFITILNDWSSPADYKRGVFNREGGVWKFDADNPLISAQGSAEHVGDGWYKFVTSVSGTPGNIGEGDILRYWLYPTEFTPVDKDIVAYSLISAPFIGMTGSLDVSSVPHTRGVLE